MPEREGPELDPPGLDLTGLDLTGLGLGGLDLTGPEPAGLDSAGADSAGADGAGADGAGADSAGADGAGADGAGTSSAEPPPGAIEPTSLVPPARPPAAPGPGASGPPTIPGLTLPDPPGREPRPGSSIVPLGGQRRTLVPLTPAGLAGLARGHRREAIAVLLLGVGGLLFPLPFWFVGAAAAGLSRFWEARYKWLALFGPLLFALIVSVPVAAIIRGGANPAVGYVHALRVDARYLIRLGCLATAAYLAWLVRRGRRVRVPPWRR